MGKLKKLKISKVKRNNQTKTKLSKQGKLKTRRHKRLKNQPQKSVHVSRKVEEEEEEEEENDGEDLMNMVEKEDLNFLQEAISNKSYNLLRDISITEINKNQNKEKRKKIENSQPIEELYEYNASKINERKAGKTIRMLLPIKTQNGHLEKRMIEEDYEEDNKEDNKDEDLNDEEKSEEDNKHEHNDMEMDIDSQENDKPLSTIELLGHREKILQSKRFKIGILSSSLLENPELKSGNFKILLDFMSETDPKICITVKKLATLSLLEVFKDLLPSYNITQIAQDGVKLKKETLQRQNYEVTLLRSYKNYLQKLEKMSNILRMKKGDTRQVKKSEIQLGELAVSCMCELLIVHPYFNFSVNIANHLLPFLDNKRNTVREKVLQYISQIFKEDKRGQLSLAIIQKLNKHIKSRKNSVHSEVVTVLLSLRIKDVNLDKEKEEETKQKKLMSHKQRILALSKRERKKNKKLEQIEKELFETKAEENKQAKEKTLTEIMHIVFTIYFRILKQTPNSRILSACLEGLAKFAHCININFYQDLVTAINTLIEEGNLGLREQLYCIQCVFTILSGQGTALNIDPSRFYAHLYKNVLKVHCGKTHLETEIVLKTLIQLLIHQKKRITQTRLIAFIKRISTWALQSQHNATLGILGIIKQVMQLGKAAHILLDTDISGNGYYQIEIEEPDYCNAHCTSLWEIVALQRHYHNVVRQIAKNIAYAVPTSGEGNLTIEIAKLTPEELYTEYDPASVAFKPSVPAPKKDIKKIPVICSINTEFEDYLNTVNCTDLFIDGYVDFYKACKNGDL